MTTKRILTFVTAVTLLFVVTYVSTYLTLRKQHLEYRPFYVAIMYGEDRFVVRCIERKFLEDNAVQVITCHLRTDSEWYPETRYRIETNGLFVVMNKKDKLGWYRIFWPLELMELKHISFFEKQMRNAPHGIQ